LLNKNVISNNLLQ